MSYTCKDCKYWHRLGVNFGRCDADERDYWEETPFCIHFKTADGKTPRFCRLALSVDEMANVMLVRHYNPETDTMYYEFKGLFYHERDVAIARAKRWLMEVEE